MMRIPPPLTNLNIEPLIEPCQHPVVGVCRVETQDLASLQEVFITPPFYWDEPLRSPVVQNPIKTISPITLLLTK